MELEQGSSWIQNLNKIFDFHQSIVDTMLRHKRSDNTCQVSQTAIANELGVSQSLISQTVQKLYRAGSVKQFKAGQYIVHHEDLKKEGLYPELMKMLAVFALEPSLVALTYVQQAELFDVDMRDVQAFWAYVRYATDNFERIE